MASFAQAVTLLLVVAGVCAIAWSVLYPDALSDTNSLLQGVVEMNSNNTASSTGLRIPPSSTSSSSSLSVSTITINTILNNQHFHVDDLTGFHFQATCPGTTAVFPVFIEALKPRVVSLWARVPDDRSRFIAISTVLTSVVTPFSAVFNKHAVNTQDTLAQWNFDNGAGSPIVSDVTGQGNPLMLVNNPSWVNDIGGIGLDAHPNVGYTNSYAVSLDGSLSQHLSSHSLLAGVPPSSGSIVIRFSWTLEPTSPTFVFSKHQRFGSTAFAGIDLRFQSGRFMAFLQMGDGTRYYAQTPLFTPVLHVMQHAVMQWGPPNGLELWMNGVRMGALPQVLSSWSWQSSSSGDPYPFTLGSDESGASMVVSEAFVSSRQLSRNEIVASWQNVNVVPNRTTMYEKSMVASSALVYADQTFSLESVVQEPCLFIDPITLRPSMLYAAGYFQPELLMRADLSPLDNTTWIEAPYPLLGTDRDGSVWNGWSSSVAHPGLTGPDANGIWYLFFCTDAFSGTFYHATAPSTNLSDWTVQPQSFFPQQNSYFPYSNCGNTGAWLEDGVWTLFVEVRTPDGWTMHALRGTDLYNLLPVPNHNADTSLGVVDSIGGPEIHKVNDTYYMFLHYATTGFTPSYLACVISYDLVTWIPYQNNPITTFYPGQNQLVQQDQVADWSGVEWQGRTIVAWSEVDNSAPAGFIKVITYPGSFSSFVSDTLAPSIV